MAGASLNRLVSTTMVSPFQRRQIDWPHTF